MLALSLSYDVTFGWPAAWGAIDDVRDNLTRDEVRDVIDPQVADPSSYPWLEFIRRVNRLPEETFHNPRGTAQSIGYVVRMLFATEFRAELESRAKAPVAQNSDHVYTLSDADLDELWSLGLDAEPLLEAMNERSSYKAPRKGRSYVKRYSDFRGKIKRPVLAIHNTWDSLAPAWNQALYRESVQAAGKEHLLSQVFVGVDFMGTSPCMFCEHCDFHPLQILNALAAMEFWIEFGVRPPEDVFFPSELGFVPGFVPPAWPYGNDDANEDEEDDGED
jgi:hypothetical protein